MSFDLYWLRNLLIWEIRKREEHFDDSDESGDSRNVRSLESVCFWVLKFGFWMSREKERGGFEKAGSGLEKGACGTSVEQEKSRRSLNK